MKEWALAEALAQSVHDNGGVYSVPAFVGLGAPHYKRCRVAGTLLRHRASAGLDSGAVYGYSVR